MDTKESNPVGVLPYAPFDSQRFPVLRAVIAFAGVQGIGRAVIYSMMTYQRLWYSGSLIVRDSVFMFISTIAAYVVVIAAVLALLRTRLSILLLIVGEIGMVIGMIASDLQMMGNRPAEIIALASFFLWQLSLPLLVIFLLSNRKVRNELLRQAE